MIVILAGPMQASNSKQYFEASNFFAILWHQLKVNNPNQNKKFKNDFILLTDYSI